MEADEKADKEEEKTEDVCKRVRWPGLVDFVFGAAAAVVVVFL